MLRAAERCKEGMSDGLEKLVATVQSEAQQFEQQKAQLGSERATIEEECKLVRQERAQSSAARQPASWIFCCSLLISSFTGWEVSERAIYTGCRWKHFQDDNSYPEE